MSAHTQDKTRASGTEPCKTPPQIVLPFKSCIVFLGRVSGKAYCTLFSHSSMICPKRLTSYLRSFIMK